VGHWKNVWLRRNPSTLGRIFELKGVETKGPQGPQGGWAVMGKRLCGRLPYGQKGVLLEPKGRGAKIRKAEKDLKKELPDKKGKPGSETKKQGVQGI